MFNTAFGPFNILSSTRIVIRVVLRDINISAGNYSSVPFYKKLSTALEHPMHMDITRENEI